MTFPFLRTSRLVHTETGFEVNACSGVDWHHFSEHVGHRKTTWCCTQLIPAHTYRGLLHQVGDVGDHTRRMTTGEPAMDPKCKLSQRLIPFSRGRSAAGPQKKVQNSHCDRRRRSFYSPTYSPTCQSPRFPWARETAANADDGVPRIQPHARESQQSAAEPALANLCSTHNTQLSRNRSWASSNR